MSRERKGGLKRVLSSWGEGLCFPLFQRARGQGEWGSTGRASCEAAAARVGPADRLMLRCHIFVVVFLLRGYFRACVATGNRSQVRDRAKSSMLSDT